MSIAQLTNKHIILGVTGGIAAYKAAELIRLLRNQKAHVRVVMTKGAREFITPLTLQALSGNPVHLDLLDPEAEAGMGHIELAKWADLVLVAPASANFIARMASGQADDLLTTLCLATIAPIALAPAMNQAMWLNAHTQENCQQLQDKGVHFFGPGSGTQACGDVGPGRMLEPSELTELSAALFPSGLLNGKKVVITAGPTREAIDPVRYISNHSSGKMGFAIAQAAIDGGAQTTLIAGPVNLNTPDGAIRHDVTSAQQMYETAISAVTDCDIFIATAAVADYRPTQCVDQKIKKSNECLSIELIRNPDIVSAIAALERRPFTVGFAAETQQVIEYAHDKLKRKNLDMIVANDVAAEGIGFNSDDNAVTLVWSDGQHHINKTSKRQLAKLIMEHIVKHYQHTNS